MQWIKPTLSSNVIKGQSTRGGKKILKIVRTKFFHYGGDDLQISKGGWNDPCSNG